MKICAVSGGLAATISLVYLVSGGSAIAQITSDGTLSTTVNTSNSSDFTIENGDRAGNNLFHSFSEFSVPTGGSAFFNNAADVQNIFSRVTGSNISNIDGLIRANGSANLFLLNPNGLLFGPNARLELGGSFIGTTANRIRFADGVEFAAADTTVAPLLTTSVPIGLQMGTQANSIQQRSQALDPVTNAPAGLKVSTGQTVGLLGGDLQFDGGMITAPNGRIELGSVAPNSTVRLIALQPGWQLDYTGVQQFQAIDLTNQSILSIVGDTGGDIQIQGRTLRMQEASKLLADTLGQGRGGQVLLRGSERIEIIGNNGLSNPTAIFSNLADGATGNANSIVIETPNLQMSQVALVTAENYGAGRGGDLTLRADQISLLGSPNIDDPPMFISTRVINGSGQGGNLTVEADQLSASQWLLLIADTVTDGNSGNLRIDVDRLQVLNGGQIGSGTFGAGNGGNLTINASESIEVGGFSFSVGVNGFVSTGLFASAEPPSSGNGGSLNITTGSLRIFNGGFVGAGTSGSGSSGNLTIRAREIEVADPVLTFTGQVSGLRVAADGENSAAGGTMSITADRLRVLRGGQVTSSTQGIGNAGNISIQVGEVEVDGTSENGTYNSSIFASSTTGANAGSITFAGDRLSVRNRGNITVSNTGTGNAGNMTLNVNTVQLDQQGSLRADTRNGQGGRIQLNTQALTLNNSSVIDSSTTGAGNAGQVQITTNVATLRNSTISSQTSGSGQGGTILLTAAESINLSDTARLLAQSTGVGNAGSMTLNTPEINIQEKSELSSSTAAQGDAGNLNITANLLNLSQNSQISSESTGTMADAGDAGAINLQVRDRLSSNNSSISTRTASNGRGGQIQLTTNQLSLQNGSLIDSSTAGGGNAGQIQITSNTASLQRSSISSQTNGTGQGGTINFTNRGSLTLNNRSNILAQSSRTGNAGVLQVSTRQLDLNSNSAISSSTAGQGNAGNLQVRANTVELMGNAEISSASTSNQEDAGNAGEVNLQVRDRLTAINSIISASAQQGAGGNLNLTAPQVTLSNSTISSQTSGSGRGGNLRINAPQSITLDNDAQLIAQSSGSGNAGAIALTTDRLNIQGGSAISAASRGEGRGGSITIRAGESITVADDSRMSAASSSDAAAGSIRLRTPTLQVQSGGRISVSGAGAGGAGNLQVRANRIDLRDNASMSAEVAAGTEGNIELVAPTISMQRRSEITTSATGTATGGNLRIRSEYLIGQNNSDIIANAIQGQGGQIAIAAQSILGLEYRNQRTAGNDISASSQFGINGSVTLETPNVNPSSGLMELPTDLVDSSQQVAQACASSQDSRFVASGRGGLPIDPTRSMESYHPWSDLRDVSGGETHPSDVFGAVINSDPVTALTEASGWRVNAQGQVELVAVASNAPSHFGAATCQAAL
jgi:filamentous hemagglutinin family protein